MSEERTINFDEIYLSRRERAILKQSIFPPEFRTQNSLLKHIYRMDSTRALHFRGWKSDEVININRLRNLGFIANHEEWDYSMGPLGDPLEEIYALIPPPFMQRSSPFFSSLIYVKTTYLGIDYLHYYQNKKKDKNTIWIRYWITTGIAIAALIKSFSAELSQLWDLLAGKFVP